jgi:hypothetical protein
MRMDSQHPVDAANDTTRRPANYAANETTNRSESTIAGVRAAVSPVVNPPRYALRLGHKRHCKSDAMANVDDMSGLRMVGNRIVSDDCPGIAWKPATKRGQIDRASTLREVIRGRRAVIVRQVRIGMV